MKILASDYDKPVNRSYLLKISFEFLRDAL